MSKASLYRGKTRHVSWPATETPWSSTPPTDMTSVQREEFFPTVAIWRLSTAPAAMTAEHARIEARMSALRHAQQAAKQLQRETHHLT